MAQIDIDKFHNELALSIGYEVLGNNLIDVQVNYKKPNNLWVEISVYDNKHSFGFNASKNIEIVMEELRDNKKMLRMIAELNLGKTLCSIIQGIHESYLKAIENTPQTFSSNCNATI